MARIGGAPAILAALVAAGAALAAPIAAGGAMPEFHTIVVDDAFVDGLWSATCGFAVRQRVEGSIKVSERADEAGRLASRIERYRLSHTLIGPGGELSWPDRGANTRFVFNPDGTITTTAAGPILRLTAPGAGLVLADLGRHTVTFAVDPDTGEIVDEVVLWKAGPSPDDVDQADLAAVCAALAG